MYVYVCTYDEYNLLNIRVIIRQLFPRRPGPQIKGVSCGFHYSPPLQLEVLTSV